VVSDPLVPKILQRLRRSDPTAARLVELALDELLDEGGLAELTQHDLQTYLWFTLADASEPLRVAGALAQFLELAEMNRYAAIAASPQTADILRTYEERGRSTGTRVATRAMDMSGILPPDLPELEWGEIMGTEEIQAYERIAATLELALAAGEIRPGGRGWRATQIRLARQQLTMPRLDGPPLLERVTTERLETWAESGGQARRAMAATIVADLAQEQTPPRDVADRMAPMQWLLEIAAGRVGESPGVPLTVGGNLSRKIVQEAADRFGWWEFPDRAPRTESDIWRLLELRSMLQRAGVLRRSARRLVLGTRGRPLLGDPVAQWNLATGNLVDATDFDSAAQEAALMLLLGARGMVEMRELVREVAEILSGSGWRDTGNGAPPDERDVSRAVWSLIRRCELWSLVDEGKGPGFTTRLRLSEVGQRGGHAALRSLALRPRLDVEA
jgi:hypothetical protein